MNVDAPTFMMTESLEWYDGPLVFLAEDCDSKYLGIWNEGADYLLIPISENEESRYMKGSLSWGELAEGKQLFLLKHGEKGTRFVRLTDKQKKRKQYKLPFDVYHEG